MTTRFFLVRHAVVTPHERAYLYGRRDVPICDEAMAINAGILTALDAYLPREAHYVVTPLQRTAQTLAAIRGPGIQPVIEDDFIEQDMGDWQGLTHAELPAHLEQPAHAFWPLGAAETPPRGESMDQVVVRVGQVLERLARTHHGRDIVVVSHGGAIRGAIAHALGVGAHAALHISIYNLSLTQLERHDIGWRVLSVNEMLGQTLMA